MIIFSFTTTPVRIHKIEPMLKSILTGKNKPDIVILNLPRKRFEGVEIPKFIENELVQINYFEGPDLGPASKVIPTIEYLKSEGFDDDTVVIYGDDDIGYDNRLFEYVSELDADKVWALSGLNLSFGGRDGKKLCLQQVGGHGTVCDVAEGWGGVICRLKHFEQMNIDEIKKLILGDPDLKFSDDLVLSNYFHSGIPILCIELPNCRLRFNKILTYGEGTDALHKQKGGGNRGRYERCISKLHALMERTRKK